MKFAIDSDLIEAAQIMGKSEVCTAGRVKDRGVRVPSFTLPPRSESSDTW